MRTRPAWLSVVPATVQDMSDQLAEYEAWMLAWGATPATITSRTSIIRCGVGVWGDPEHVTRDQLEAWLASPTHAAWTRYTYFSALRSYFGWMLETGRIAGDPTHGMRRPRLPKGKPRPLTPIEAAAVLNSARGNQRAWIMLGMFAGLRVHEIAKIAGQDVHQDAIYVRGKGGKTAFLPTHPSLWELAMAYPRDGFWFPSTRTLSGHVDPRSITGMTSKHFAAVGVEGSTHRCRHSYATNLLRNGANLRVVQTLMRHESLATTALYTAVDEDERSAAIRSLVA